MVNKNSTKEFDLFVRDGRRKMFLTLDVETAGDITKGTNAVYDLGFAVHDKQGRTYYKRNFIIAEVFDNVDLMATAYYAKKIPLYIEMLRNGTAEKVSLKQAINFMVKCVREYGIDTICAYNLLFDAKAIRYTLKKFLPQTYGQFKYKDPFTFWEVAILRQPMNFICIYNFACQVIATQKSYAKMALKYNGIMSKNDWITEADHVRTNAQCMNRYITNDYQFIEAHTALSDVEIELQILAKCYRQHKKFDKTIDPFPWQIPQPIFYQVREEMFACLE